MKKNAKEIRTPEKQLLIGVLSEKDDGLYLTVKNRGKVDYIAVDSLMTVIAEYIPQPNHTKIE